MSAAAATAPDAAPKKGKKKLIVLLAVVLVVLLAGAGGALFLLTKQAAHANDEEAEDVAQPAKQAAKAAPTFVPLEVFTVNLADRHTERYAQIGITLEVTDAKTADQIKAFMPAIRNNILMVLAHKTADELLQREGKQKLAAEIRRETLRPLGYDVPADDDEHAADDDAAPRKKRKRAAESLPVTQVHFSNFIIQ